MFFPKRELTSDIYCEIVNDIVFNKNFESKQWLDWRVLDGERIEIVILTEDVSKKMILTDCSQKQAEHLLNLINKLIPISSKADYVIELYSTDPCE